MIKIKNLSYVYEDGSVALKDISMDFKNIPIIGVIGVNGAGKSTLFNNILGLYQPTEGQILYRGEKLKYKREFLANYRTQVNMVFQNPDQQIFFSKIFDDVAFALRNMGHKEEEIKDRVMKSLEAVGLLDMTEKPVHFLSYGQKKRVAIASVLALDCEIILMDEPTAGLDPRMTQEMTALISNLKERGKQVILSSHDMDFIYEVCDYIYILKDHQIFKEGLKEEVFLNREDILSAGLIQPSLVKFHTQADTPLFEEETELLQYVRQFKK